MKGIDLGIYAADIEGMKRVDEPIVKYREGFEVCENRPGTITDFGYLDPKTQRELEICDLFPSGNFTIAEIINLSQEDYRTVIRSLVAQGVVKDRRRTVGRGPKGIERRRPQD